MDILEETEAFIMFSPNPIEIYDGNFVHIDDATKYGIYLISVPKNKEDVMWISISSNIKLEEISLNDALRFSLIKGAV